MSVRTGPEGNGKLAGWDNQNRLNWKQFPTTTTLHQDELFSFSILTQPLSRRMRKPRLHKFGRAGLLDKGKQHFSVFKDFQFLSLQRIWLVLTDQEQSRSSDDKNNKIPKCVEFYISLLLFSVSYMTTTSRKNIEYPQTKENRNVGNVSSCRKRPSSANHTAAFLSHDYVRLMRRQGLHHVL